MTPFTPSSHLVQAANLSARPSRRGRQAIDGVSFDLGVGVVGLLGVNGAGKSTLMRVLSTALRPQSGRLSILGTSFPTTEAHARRVRAKIGYSPQGLVAIRHMRVLEQVQYAAWLKGMNSSQAALAAESALSRVDLTQYSKERVKTLSGGMLRRLNLAMAIVADPSILLLDEPTAGLDPSQRSRFRSLVSELGQTRLVLLSTHLIEDVSAACNSVLVLEAGKLLFAGPVDELRKRHHSDLEDASESLESAFLNMTGHGGPHV